VTAAPGCIDVAGQYTDPFGNGVAVAQHGCEVVATYTPTQPFSPATGRAFATDVVLLYPTIGNLSATVQPDSAALKWSNGVLWRKDGPLPKMPTIWLPTAGPVRCVDVAERTTQCLGIQFGTAERWQRPMLATWTEPRDALVYGPQCAQQGCAAINGSTLLPGCSEECLFLNVFAPRQGLHPPGTKHPVVVWIHGGGYELYSSHGLNGTTRVEASGGDLVWVTIEYRLAAFGFLGHEQMRKLDRSGSVGNYGLQDQVSHAIGLSRSIVEPYQPRRSQALEKIEKCWLETAVILPIRLCVCGSGWRLSGFKRTSPPLAETQRMS
jgi:hypothetical protein